MAVRRWSAPVSFLRSLPADAKLLDVFRRYPSTALPLLEFHEILMRGPSPLSVAERELLAAFVSALNACGYCHGVHEAVAGRFGVAAGTLGALIENVDSAPVEERFRPLLRYVHKLTVEPGRITLQDARAVYEAGWDERALHDAVAVCGLFNLMNRLVEGLGLEADPGYAVVAGKRLHETGYAGLKSLLAT